MVVFLLKQIKLLTSTVVKSGNQYDHNGKFKVGDTFTVNQRTGEVSISLDAYRPELINDLTPQLGGDLDVNGKNITGTVKLNGLTYPSSDGGANHVIATNGSGTLSFQSVSSLQGSESISCGRHNTAAWWGFRHQRKGSCHHQ